MHRPLGLAAKELGGQVLGAACLNRPQVELARVGSAKGQQVGQAFVGGVVGHHHRHVKQAQQRHRRKVGAGVEGLGFEQTGTHGGGVGHEQQGVAIGLGPGHQFARHHAPCAGPVVHHHGLTPGLRQGLAHGAGRQIGDTAWAKGHDDAHRF